MKTILLLTLTILPLSACGLIGTAVGTGVGIGTKAVTTTVDILTENTLEDNQNTPHKIPSQDTALAFTAQ